MEEVRLIAILGKENDRWKIRLEATSALEKRQVGKMIEENSSPVRDSGAVLVLWETSSQARTDKTAVDWMEFMISEGPDSDGFDEAIEGLKILNLEGFFRKRQT